MPDIAKLDQLCQVLEIGMEELLGTDRSSEVLTRIIRGEEDAADGADPVSMEEIRDVAPLLPPDTVKKLVDDSAGMRGGEEPLNLSAIIGLAPFLDREYLDGLAKRASVDSLRELTGLAPFVSSEVLDELVRNADPETDMKGIIALAPFLSKEYLDSLVRKIGTDNLRELTGLAPFVSSGVLDELVRNMDPETDMKGITALAPFLSSETLRKLAEALVQNGDLSSLKSVTPFL